jgi:hypothetical protein
MSDRRFSSLEDGELADIWYALGGAAIRHPEHFQTLYDAAFNELLSRRGEEGLNPWLEQRHRGFRLADSREDAHATASAADTPARGSTPAAASDDLPPVPDVGIG